jgi:molecular chaperone GrpE
MNSDVQKNELLGQFQAYLEANVPESYATEQPDLHTLLSEFTGLKAEVKAESRQFKNTLDTLSSALATVQDDNKALSEQQAKSVMKQDEAIQTMLLEFIDIYDSLITGIDVLQNYRPVETLLKSSRKQDVKFIKRFKEGQLMTLKRFDQLLLKHQVSAIDCVGKLLDPTTMTAIETVSDKRAENGIVLEQLRAGFLYKNQVLRLAEVKVNSVRIL